MAEIGITVPEQLIKDLVRAAIVRELGDQTKLVEGVIQEALASKKNSYDNKSMFATEVEKMIRETAISTMREWLESNREKIRQSFLDYLNSKDGHAGTKLVEALINGISAGGFRVKVNFDFEE